MDTDMQSFQTVLIEISSLDLTVDGNFAARISPLLREEYPKRMEPEGSYVALNKEHNRAIIITHESIVIREDEVEDPSKSMDMILKNLGQLPDIIDWADGALTTVTFRCRTRIARLCFRVFRRTAVS